MESTRKRWRLCVAKITNLVEGHDYYIRVFAQNEAGLSEQSAEIRPPVRARLPFEPPLPPSSFHLVNVSDGSVQLAWRPPKFDCGSPITNYLIESCKSGCSNWIACAEVGSTENMTDVKGLETGEYFFFRIFAVNEAGCSKKSVELGEAILCKAPQSLFIITT
ncbi:hypothetical protein HELRODRAFT_166894 [Helobdella robusta]|uniref:Fibronectin type-III domain-containing protein n=1 Tax=Helobdella robusta TaxID=6412 RepID=T1EYQ1_HELRO|nr:hypothetical protein HELRODRAFT_166894 [Helobdella robusta]ESO11834.1 hypothetical protein HELRODRAFT_166894 [Helobdella robusta]